MLTYGVDEFHQIPFDLAKSFKTAGRAWSGATHFQFFN